MKYQFLWLYLKCNFAITFFCISSRSDQGRRANPCPCPAVEAAKLEYEDLVPQPRKPNSNYRFDSSSPIEPPTLGLSLGHQGHGGLFK